MSNESQKSNSYPPWAPRIWTGFRPLTHWQLLAENGFSIHPSRYPMTGLITFWSMFNAAFSMAQKIGFQQKIERTSLTEPPIFLIGHWRSGTTLLHELMCLDDRFAFPSNFETFVPHHFLVSQPIVMPLLKLLLPKKRPMDNMSVYPDSPQEDEFALMVLGAASQYRRMAFPHTKNEYYRYLDAENLAPEQLEFLKQQIKLFFKALTYKYGKRLILKSPPHTGRIRSLAQWFPGARFVHISRHPYEIVPSTMRLWKIVDGVHAYQKPRYTDEELMDYICQCKDVMYAAYFRDQSILDSKQIVEIRFDDLTSDPAGTIGRIYEQLELGDCSQVTKSVKENFENRKGHRKNVYDVDDLVERIDSEWADYMQRFGYENRVGDSQRTCAV